MGVAASLNSSAEPIGGMSAGFKCQEHLLSSGSASLPLTSVHVGIRCDHTRHREMNAIWFV